MGVGVVGWMGTGVAAAFPLSLQAIVHICVQKCEIITPRVPVKNHTTACRRIAAVPIN